MIQWREGINPLELLANSGFTTYQLRKQKIWGEATIQKFRKGGLPTWKELNFICKVSAYKIEDLIVFKWGDNETLWD